jgi:uncharacterized membrane protein
LRHGYGSFPVHVQFAAASCSWYCYIAIFRSAICTAHHLLTLFCNSVIKESIIYIRVNNAVVLRKTGLSHYASLLKRLRNIFKYLCSNVFNSIFHCHWMESIMLNNITKFQLDPFNSENSVMHLSNFEQYFYLSPFSVTSQNEDRHFRLKE